MHINWVFLTHKSNSYIRSSEKSFFGKLNHMVFFYSGENWYGKKSSNVKRKQFWYTRDQEFKTTKKDEKKAMGKSFLHLKILFFFAISTFARVEKDHSVSEELRITQYISVMESPCFNSRKKVLTKMCTGNFRSWPWSILLELWQTHLLGILW